MQLTIDKFGRILIPKPIRQILGLKPGKAVELKLEPEQSLITLKPIVTEEPTLVVSEAGIPTFYWQDSSISNFDVVELIRKDREERADKIWGV